MKDGQSQADSALMASESSGLEKNCDVLLKISTVIAGFDIQDILSLRSKLPN
jgi:hypothetical protein